MALIVVTMAAEDRFMSPTRGSSVDPATVPLRERPAHLPPAGTLPAFPSGVDPEAFTRDQRVILEQVYFEQERRRNMEVETLRA